MVLNISIVASELLRPLSDALTVGQPMTLLVLFGDTLVPHYNHGFHVIVIYLKNYSNA
jgi:hypothetical protein